jgi:hypothetical protein
MTNVDKRQDGKAREALEEIARRPLSVDMSIDDQLGGDFEGAYNHIIERAREALAAINRQAAPEATDGHD